MYVISATARHQAFNGQTVYWTGSRWQDDIPEGQHPLQVEEDLMEFIDAGLEVSYRLDILTVG